MKRVGLGLMVLVACVPAFAQRSDGAIRITTPGGSASDQNSAFSPAGATLCFTRFDSGYNNGPASVFLVDLRRSP